MPCVCVHTRLRTHNTGHRPIRGKTSGMFLKAPDTVFLVLRVRRISAFRRTAVWGIFYANYFSGLLFRRAVRTEMFSAARDFVKPFHAGVPAHAAVVHAGRASVRPGPGRFILRRGCTKRDHRISMVSFLVENTRVELVTSCMPCKRSSQLS